MKLNWIKPNLNGFVIFICAASLLFFIYILFVPKKVSNLIILEEGIELIPIKEFTLNWIIFALLCVLAYPISMRLGCGIPKQKKMPPASFFQYIIFVIVVFSLEILCSFLAYYTWGEVICRLYFIVVVVLNLVFIVISIRSRIIATLLTFLLAMVIIPLQVYLGIHLYRVQLEAARVVTYAYEYKLNNGQFPNNLSEYKFVDSDMKDFISLSLAGESNDVLEVSYWVVSTDIIYWYSSESGWNYYPD